MTRLLPAEVVRPETAPDDPRLGRLLGRTRDLGDVEISGDVEANQQRLGEVLNPYIELGCFCVVLGGGHQTSYGHFLGYAREACPFRRAPGAREAVSSADIVELNPAVDRDGQTARLAAVTVWWLLRGRSERRQADDLRAVRQGCTVGTIPAKYSPSISEAP